ncbi:MAG: phosphoglycerate kinase [Candidatus Pacebacteria bacterium]|nr:phosphoglycerate kinase [Candidatus Paceibacterota bacterium]
MKFLSEQNKEIFKGRTVLLRVDYNIDAGESSFRIDASIPSIKFLLDAGSKIVILTHKGRPKPITDSVTAREDIANFSLEKTVAVLERKIIKKIKFVNFADIKTITKIVKEETSSIIMLENLRFFDGEDSGALQFGRSLAGMGEIFINDAFPVSHRENASICQIPQFITSFVGIQFEKEIKNLDKILKNPERPFTLILGGAKASDKIPMINHLIDKLDNCLLSGVPGNTFLKANGEDIKKSVYEEGELIEAKEIMKTGKIKPLEDFVWENDNIYDIGPKTIDSFSAIIKNSKTILWNGPLGYFEEEKFMQGSKKIAEAIIASKAFSILGGGETTEMVAKMKLLNKFSFVSTGGGAMLEYLSGKRLPGIEVLK